MPVIKCRALKITGWESIANYDTHLGPIIHIWRLNMDTVARIDTCLAYLPADEKKRAQSYSSTLLKERYIISHALLRVLIAKYTNTIAAQIKFLKEPNNKPYISLDETNKLHFNLSYSGKIVLIALAETAVGVDVEYMDEDFPMREMIADYFSTQEIANINKATDHNNCCYQLWTRKEALVKATGKGADNDLLLIPCLDGAHSVSATTTGSPENWIVGGFTAASQYVAAIAHSPLVKAIHFFDAKNML